MTRKKNKLKKTVFDIDECCRHEKSRTDDGYWKSLAKARARQNYLIFE